MIFKGSETPYAQELAKKEASEVSATTLLTTDAPINKSIEDYIVQSSISQETLRIIKIVSDRYYLSDNDKKNLINDILKYKEE